MSDADIAELFSGLGPVTIRRMFGGKGIYHDGLIVAVVLRDELMLKGDGETAPFVEAAGGRRWTYPGKAGTPVAMPYWTVPDSWLDDPDAMAEGVRLAAGAAARSARAKASPKPRPAPRRSGRAVRS